MTASTDRFTVLTGGPGSGKTTLIDRLRAAGHGTTEEAGRAIIRDQTAIGGPALPWRDPALFAEAMLCREMHTHRTAPTEGRVFFDRGVVDVAGYLRLEGLAVPAHVDAAARVFRYHPRVFAAPPWPEIYVRDGERRQSAETAERTYEAVTAAYRHYGYDLVELPRASVAERLRFITERVPGR
jgi:predicted ATPase